MVMQAHCFGISTEPWTITNFNFPHTSTSSNWVLPPAAAGAGIFVVAFPVLSLTGFNSFWQLQEPDAKLLCSSQQSLGSHPCSAAGWTKPLILPVALMRPLNSQGSSELTRRAGAVLGSGTTVFKSWFFLSLLEHIGQVISSVGAWAFSFLIWQSKQWVFFFFWD